MPAGSPSKRLSAACMAALRPEASEISFGVPTMWFNWPAAVKTSIPSLQVASNARRLLVNADDFGLSPAVNRGLLEAHRHGLVTSASLMSNLPAAADAAAQARESPRLGLGVHLN